MFRSAVVLGLYAVNGAKSKPHEHDLPRDQRMAKPPTYIEHKYSLPEWLMAGLGPCYDRFQSESARCP